MGRAHDSWLSFSPEYSLPSFNLMMMGFVELTQSIIGLFSTFQNSASAIHILNFSISADIGASDHSTTIVACHFHFVTEIDLS
jgi:hypothetical protein